MRKKLTLKQTKFVGKYLQDGNAAKAVREAYPNVKAEATRRVMGSKLLTNANVKSHIQEILEREGLTPDLVVRELKSLITDEDKSIKTKAIRIACEVMGLVGSGGIYQQININEKPSLSEIEQEAIENMSITDKLASLRRMLETE